jgi:hypothetical protein
VLSVTSATAFQLVIKITTFPVLDLKRTGMERELNYKAIILFHLFGVGVTLELLISAREENRPKIEQGVKENRPKTEQGVKENIWN